MKKLLKKTFAYNIYKKYIINNRPSVSPTKKNHEIKRNLILEYKNKFNLKVLVESGTYFGEMVMAMKDEFNLIYTIELDKNLYTSAKKKFSLYPHIHVIQGDSGKILPSILKDIKEPCLFWLDGHFSGGITAKSDVTTPIIDELNTIKQRNHNDVILIDDARLFNGTDDYPTIDFIKNILPKKNKLEIINDIIIISK